MLRFFGWCFFGLIVGVVARFFLPGRYPIGCLPTIGLGVLGSIVGGYIWHVALANHPQYQPGGFFVSVIGAMFVLFVADRIGHAGH